MELFGPTLLRNFPLKKSDFLGIFKNVLTGFYSNNVIRNIAYKYNSVTKIYIVISAVKCINVSFGLRGDGDNA
jgi:hypothetical protein